MSLNKLMDRFTTSQFLSKSRFAEEVQFVKGDNYAGGTRVNVVWDADTMPGTNEIDGDGVVMERRSGRRVRQSIHIECDRDLNVDDTADPPDRFVRGNEVAVVKRIMANDSGGMQHVLCVRIRGVNDRGKYRMG